MSLYVCMVFSIIVTPPPPPSSLRLQHFRRELQGQMQLMAKKTRLTMQGPVKHAIFRGGPSSQKRPFNILVHCLELVLPLGNQLLHPEDRKLVASAQEKLAEVQ